MTPPTWTPPKDWSPSAAREHLRAVLRWRRARCDGSTVDKVRTRAIVLMIEGKWGHRTLAESDRFAEMLAKLTAYAASSAASTPPAPRKRPAAVSARSGGLRSKRR